jgi:hypothetical protein
MYDTIENKNEISTNLNLTAIMDNYGTLSLGNKTVKMYLWQSSFKIHTILLVYGLIYKQRYSVSSIQVYRRV